jgi:hypothetical protein
MADAPSVLVTLRLSARDRALLEQLVERERRELEDLGVEASLSSVLRKLIRIAAKASAIEVGENVHGGSLRPPQHPRRRRRRPSRRTRCGRSCARGWPNAADSAPSSRASSASSARRCRDSRLVRRAFLRANSKASTRCFDR